MEAHTERFKETASRELRNELSQIFLSLLPPGFTILRQIGMSTFPDPDAAVGQARAIRDEAVDFLDYYPGELRSNDDYRRTMIQMVPGETAVSVQRPYGVFAVIAPFNFPIALSMNMLCGALLTGNAVVYNKTKDGKVQTTAADKIFVDIVDGKAQMKVQGAGRVRPKMSQVATAPNVVATPGSGGARAMVLDQPSHAPAAPQGEDVGVSKPLAPPEASTTAPKTIKVAPVPDLGSAAPAARPAPSTGSSEKPTRIDPKDRQQMDAGQYGFEKHRDQSSGRAGSGAAMR